MSWMIVGSISRRNTKPPGKGCAAAGETKAAMARATIIGFTNYHPQIVMAGQKRVFALDVPAIHVLFLTVNKRKTWISGIKLGMTRIGQTGGKLASARFALAPPSTSAYSSRFNDPCIEIDLRPRSPAPAGNRGPFRCRYYRPARPLRGICRAQPAGRQEAHLLARPHPDQPVLRGLDPHPILVRNRGQTVRGRRHEHVGDLLLDAQGRNPGRYRGDVERHASGHSGGAAP